MSWPSSLWQSANSTTKLYLLQWKKALTSASSLKDVRSLKPPTQEEIAQFIEQGNKHSAALTSTNPNDKKKSKKACHSKFKSKEKQADDNSSHSSQDYLLPSHPHSLSIDQLSTGTSKVPPKIKNFASHLVCFNVQGAGYCGHSNDVFVVAEKSKCLLLKPQAC